MFFRGAFAAAILFITAAWWVKEVAERLTSDITELRESDDPGRKSAIVLIWIVTFFIAVAMGAFIVHLIRNVQDFLR